MCAACSALLSGGWAGGGDGCWPVRTEVLGRILGYFGLTIDEWEPVYVLRDARGGWTVVSDVSFLWKEAARMMGHPLDPLDPGLLAALA